MFNNELESEPSLVAFLVQQLGVPAVATITYLMFGSALGNAGGVIVSWVTVFAAGFAAYRAIPAYTGSGRWIWVPAVGILILGLGSEWKRTSFESAICVFFWPGANSEAWWVVMFLTLPTACCCLYSTGIWLAGRLPRSAQATPALPTDIGRRRN